MTARVQTPNGTFTTTAQRTFLISRIDYDEHGRPLFKSALNKRPGKAGEQFVIVHAAGDRPLTSYDVLIVPESSVDMSRPLGVIYEWTGSGFRTGLAITGNFGGTVHGSGKEAALGLVIITAPIVIGGVSGFIIGLVASLPEAASELSKVAVNAREQVAGYTIYEYDDQGRIRSMVLYPPREPADALVRTEFFYTGAESVPYKTEVVSMPEQKTRVIN